MKGRTSMIRRMMAAFLCALLVFSNSGVAVLAEETAIPVEETTASVDETPAADEQAAASAEESSAEEPPAESLEEQVEEPIEESVAESPEESAPLLVEETVDAAPVGDGEAAAIAQIGDATYATIAEAVEAAAEDSTILLLSNVTENITIPAGKDITLDLQGYTVTNQTNNHTLTVRGKLTVTDSGENGTIKSINNCGICVAGGTLVFEEGAVEAQEMAILMIDQGTATIKGGNFTAHDNAVLGTNGTAGRGGNTLTVNGGTFTGTIQTAGYVACGVYIANDDTVTLNGGTFEITGGAGIVARAGSVVIPKDSTLSIQTTGNVTGRVGDSRVVVPCAAIVFDSEAAYPGMTQTSAVDVSGGTFESEDADAITSVPAEDTARIPVSGGTFTSDVSNFATEGYEVVENGDGTYGVAKDVIYAAKFNAESYNLTAATYTMKATITLADGSAITSEDKAGWTLLDASGVLKQSGNTTFSGKTASLKVTRVDPTSFAAGSSTVALVKDGKTYASVTVNYSPSATIATNSSTKMIEEGEETVTELKINGVAVDISDYVITSDDKTAATVAQNGSTMSITPLKAGKATFTVEKADDTSASVKANITFKNAAAKIGDNYYDTVAKALTAANSGETVTLVSDVTESVSFSGNNPRVNGFEITLDLAGHTLTGKADTAYALRTEYGIFTVKDSVGGGGVHYGSDYAFIVTHLAGDYTSRLVLESGTFTGKTSVVQVGLSGGSGASKKYYGGELVVNGGTFKTELDDGESYDADGHFKYTLNKLDYNDSSYPGGMYIESDIKVYGGTFYNFDPMNNVAEGEGTNFVAEGKMVKTGTDGDATTYTVGQAAVASITKGDETTYYDTVQSAFDAAQTGDTVVMVGDADTGSSTSAKVSGKAITLDLAGHLITGGGYDTGVIEVLSGAALTVKDSSSEGTGEIKSTYTDPDKWITGLKVNDGGAFTLESGKLTAVDRALHNEGTSILKGGVVRCTNDTQSAIRVGSGILTVQDGATVDGGYWGIRAYGGTVNMEGGRVSSRSDSDYTHPAPSAILASSSGIVNISGGDVSGAYYGVYKSDTDAKVTISGDAVIKSTYGSGFSVGAGSSSTPFTINGGHFSDDAGNGNTFTRKGGLVLKQSADSDYPDLWSLYVEAKNLDTNKEYGTLQAAVNEADQGETIQPLVDIKLSNILDVPAGKDITLDLAGKTIEILESTEITTASTINIHKGGKLTLTDSSETEESADTGAVVNETGDLCAGISVSEGSEFIMQAGTIRSGGRGIWIGGSAYGTGVATIEGGTISAQGTGIYANNYGTAIIKGGIIDAQGTGVHAEENANATIEGGTISGGDTAGSVEKLGTGGAFVINGGKFSDTSGNDDGFTRPTGKILIDEDGDGWYELGIPIAKRVVDGQDVIYSSLKKAIEAVSVNGETITMLANSTEEPITIDKSTVEDFRFNIDLAGKTVTVSTITVNGRVTIKDSSDPSTGTIELAEGVEGAGFQLADLGVVEFDSGTIHATDRSVANVAATTELGNTVFWVGWGSAKVISDSASEPAFKVSGGIVQVAGAGSVSAVGTAIVTEGNGYAATMEGLDADPSITSTSGTAIVVNGGGASVFGGTVQGVTGGVHATAGKVLINYGTIIATDGDSVATTDAVEEFSIEDFNDNNRSAFSDAAGNQEGFTREGGKYLIKGADNLYRLGNAVAKNTTTNECYASLAAATNEAKSGETIRLVADATETATAQVGVEMTLDLNGKAISADMNNPVLRVSAPLKLIDSSATDENPVGDGSITNANDEGTGIYVRGDSGELDMQAGSVSGGLYGIEASSTNGASINGGRVHGGKYGVYDQNKIIINDGTITGGDVAAFSNSNTITINGGTIGDINSNAASIGVSENNGKIEINGGRFSDDIGNSDDTKYTLSEGKSLMDDDGDDWYTLEIKIASITKGNPAETTYYSSLASAVAAAEAEDTVVLLTDLSKEAGTALSARVDIDKDLTIDLGGKTIAVTHTSGNGSAFNIKSGTVEIKNGTIDGTGVEEIEGKTSASAVGVDDGICLVTVRSGATLNLSDDKLTMVVDSKNGSCIYPFAGGRVNIAGGTYKNLTEEDYQYNADFHGMTINQANVADQLVNITGGTFYGQDPRDGDDSGLCTNFVDPEYASVFTGRASYDPVGPTVYEIAPTKPVVLELGAEHAEIANAVIASMDDEGYIATADGSKLTVLYPVKEYDLDDSFFDGYVRDATVADVQSAMRFPILSALQDTDVKHAGKAYGGIGQKQDGYGSWDEVIAELRDDEGTSPKLIDLEEAPVLYALWAEPITQVDLTVEPLVEGTKVSGEEIEGDSDSYKQDPQPIIRVLTNHLYIDFDEDSESKEELAYWFTDNKGYSGDILNDTVKAGQTYIADFSVAPEFGYLYDFKSPSLTLTVNGEEIGEKYYRVIFASPMYVRVPITAKEAVAKRTVEYFDPENPEADTVVKEFYYPSLHEAIDAAVFDETVLDETVTLLKDTTDCITFDGGARWVTLDLNGKIWTVDQSEGIKAVVSGELIIENGTIQAADGVDNLISASDDGYINLGKNLTVKAATSALYAYDKGMIIVNGATVNGGSKDATVFVDGYASAIHVEGGVVNGPSADYPTVSVKNKGSFFLHGTGVVNATHSSALRVEGEVSHADIYGDGILKTSAEDPAFCAGFALDQGTINIISGEVISEYGGGLAATNDGIIEVGEVEMDETMTGDGVITVPDGQYALIAHEGGNAKVTIYSGTVNGAVGAGSESGTGSVTVEGGTINGDLYSNAGTMSVEGGVVNGEVYNHTDDATNFRINGGVFKTTTGNGVAFTRKDEQMLVEITSGEHTGMYELGNAVASIERDGKTNYYTSLGAAQSDLKSETETITLLKDVTENLYVKKKFTLDLNGHSIFAPSEISSEAIWVSETGDLTIKDTSAAGTGKVIGTETTHAVINNGLLTIESGTFEVKSSGYPVYNLGSGESVVAKTTIKGGTFIGGESGSLKNSEETGGYKEHFVISGGKFNDDIGNDNDKFTRPANKYLADKDGDGWYELTDVNKSALEASLTAAKSAEKDVATADDEEAVKDLADGTVYTTEAEKEALDDAIDAAQKVFDDPQAIQSAVDAAVEALNAAKETYEAAKKRASTDKSELEEALAAAGEKAEEEITESKDGKDLKPGTDYVTPAAKQALKDAIAAAKEVFEDPQASQNKVDAAKAAVEAAKEAYEAAKKTASTDKSKLEETITTAEEKAAEDIEESEDGKDLKPGTPYVAPAAKEALKNAIAAAKEVFDDPEATQNEIDNAKKALDQAMETYEKAKKTVEKKYDSAALVSGHTYTFVCAKNQNYVLDIAGGSVKSGANANIYKKNGSEAQAFTLKKLSDGTWTITNYKGVALTVTGSSKNNKANVQIAEPNSSAAQRWRIIENKDGSITVINKNSGKALDVVSAKMANKQNVQQYTSNSTIGQKWVLADVTGKMAKKTYEGTKVLTSAINKNYALDIKGASKANKANAQLYRKNGTKAQQYRFVYRGSGLYSIHNVNSGKALDVDGAKAQNGRNVQQYTWNGTKAQLWKIVKNSDGTLTIKSAVNQKFVLDVVGGKAQNGRNVQIYQSNGTKAQKWTLS